jgi:2-C-methyl-D-erythritol 4-phosphate cytidylyltransferase
MTQAPRYFALIPAAGVGARMGAGSPKQYIKIGGKPMLRHTLDAFLSSDLIAHTFVVVSPDDPYIDAVAPNHGVTVLRCGGASRMESVRNGLAVLASTLAPTDWVLVHDAARPGLNRRADRKADQQHRRPPGRRPAGLPVVDTVKRCIDGEACGTMPAQRPVAGADPADVPLQLLREALTAATDPEYDYR